MQGKVGLQLAEHFKHNIISNGRNGHLWVVDFQRFSFHRMDKMAYAPSQNRAYEEKINLRALVVLQNVIPVRRNSVSKIKLTAVP